MRILIACEYSGIVRDAFIAKGHEAVSCDILPTESPGPHIQGDVLPWLTSDWDMLIAFPPCTRLAVSGSKWFRKYKIEQREAIRFFLEFVNAPIKRIAVENPVGIMSTLYRKPDQIIQPYEYGEDASKKTCLWLKNLPLLRPTQFVEPRIVNGKPRWSNQTDSGQNRLTPSPDRAKNRSKTYEGIANAMANQWG